MRQESVKRVSIGSNFFSVMKDYLPISSKSWDDQIHFETSIELFDFFLNDEIHFSIIYPLAGKFVQNVYAIRYASA